MSAYVVIAGEQPFGDSGARRVDERFRCERLAARACEAEDPRAETQVLEKPTHHGELEVRVRVDEPGQERDIAEVDVGASGRTAPFADVRNPPVVLHDRTVLDRRTGDRQHPSRVVPDHALVRRAARTGRTGRRRAPRSGARAQVGT